MYTSIINLTHILLVQLCFPGQGLGGNQGHSDHDILCEIRNALQEPSLVYWTSFKQTLHLPAIAQSLGLRMQTGRRKIAPRSSHHWQDLAGSWSPGLRQTTTRPSLSVSSWESSIWAGPMRNVALICQNSITIHLFPSSAMGYGHYTRSSNSIRRALKHPSTIGIKFKFIIREHVGLLVAVGSCGS